MKTTTTISFEVEQFKKLKEEAYLKKMSMGNFVREAVSEYISTIESERSLTSEYQEN